METKTLNDTVDETLTETDAETLGDTLDDNLPEAKAERYWDILGDVKAKALAAPLAFTLAEGGDDTHDETNS